MEKKIGALTFQKVAKTGNVRKNYGTAEILPRNTMNRYNCTYLFLSGKNRFSLRNFPAFVEEISCLFCREKMAIGNVEKKKKIWGINFESSVGRQIFFYRKSMKII